MIGRVRAGVGGVSYVETPAGLLALHGPELEPFPFSLVLPDGELGEAPAGARVELSLGYVEIAGRRYRALPLVRPPTVPALNDHPALRAALEMRERIADRRRVLACELAPVEMHLAAGEFEAIAERLVGWGPGLTPSGDDLLVGFAAGVRLTGRREVAAAALAPAVARARDEGTTFVSRALLEAASAGRFPPALGGLSTPDPAVRGRAIDRIATIGSRSGVDLLVGVGLGLRPGG